MQIRKVLAEFWDFLWNDDSLLSWLLNIAVAFIVIRFMVYPLLGLLFGTHFPIVAVVSGSMEHDGNFDTWWSSTAYCDQQLCTQKDFYAKFGIDKERFRTFDYPDGFDTGDIMVLVGTPPEHLHVGEIVVFFSSAGEPIIHRIVVAQKQNGAYVFQTKGDHNTASIHSPGVLDEMSIPEDTLIGKAVLRIPYLGYVKIWFFNFIAFIGSIVRAII